MATTRRRRKKQVETLEGLIQKDTDDPTLGLILFATGYSGYSCGGLVPESFENKRVRVTIEEID